MILLAKLSLSGALMILVIALLRSALHRRVHRSVWLILWMLAAVRLLLPVFIPAPTSFLNLPLFRPVPSAVQAPVSGAAPVRHVPWLMLVWLLGCGTVLAVVFGGHLHNLRSYRTALPADEVPDYVPDRVRLCTLDGLRSPLTYGMFRPTVLLPAAFPMEDRARLDHVLQHELAHIRNWDVLRKSVLLIAAAVHWFNPAVWLMVYLSNQDMEMRCDAQAVTHLGGERVAYARSLIAAEKDLLCSYLPVGFARSATEARILALARDRGRPWCSTLTGAVAAVVLAAVFLTGQRPILPPAPVPQAPAVVLTNAAPAEAPAAAPVQPEAPLPPSHLPSPAPVFSAQPASPSESAAPVPSAPPAEPAQPVVVAVSAAPVQNPAPAVAPTVPEPPAPAEPAAPAVSEAPSAEPSPSVPEVSDPEPAAPVEPASVPEAAPPAAPPEEVPEAPAAQAPEKTPEAPVCEEAIESNLNLSGSVHTRHD